jgi:hypothetical protein
MNGAETKQLALLSRIKLFVSGGLFLVEIYGCQKASPETAPQMYRYAEWKGKA